MKSLTLPTREQQDAIDIELAAHRRLDFRFTKDFRGIRAQSLVKGAAELTGTSERECEHPHCSGTEIVVIETLLQRITYCHDGLEEILGEPLNLLDEDLTPLGSVKAIRAVHESTRTHTALIIDPHSPFDRFVGVTHFGQNMILGRPYFHDFFTRVLDRNIESLKKRCSSRVSNKTRAKITAWGLLSLEPTLSEVS